jgi:hypothetical protein
MRRPWPTKGCCAMDDKRLIAEFCVHGDFSKASTLSVNIFEKSNNCQFFKKFLFLE